MNSCAQSPDVEVAEGEGLQGIIYVKQSQGMGYSAVEGEIVALTCDYVRINTGEKDRQRLLYSRDVVRQIKLSAILAREGTSNQKNSKVYRDWQRTADTCWNRSKSLFVAIAQSIPVVGPSLSFLDNVPGGFDTLVASVILFLCLLYGSFRLYQIFLATARASIANNEKIKREVIKLGYEIETLKHALGVTTSEAPLEPPRIAVFPHPSLSVTPIQFREFFRHKLLRLPDEADIDRRREMQRNRWQALLVRDRPALRRHFYGYLVFNYLATTVVGLFCISFVLDVIFVLVMPGFYEDLPWTTALGLAVVYAVLFVVSVSAWQRLNIRRRILREAYNDVCAKTRAAAA